MVGFGFGLVWFGVVWFGLVWFGLVWFGVWFGFGLVWFGLAFLLCLLSFHTGSFSCPPAPSPPRPVYPTSAFSALEGLGLQLDSQYSIVNECFPYLARRLLTEDSERMHKMLRTFLYGKEGRYLQVRWHKISTKGAE